jgi:hypothetical protein
VASSGSLAASFPPNLRGSRERWGSFGYSRCKYPHREKTQKSEAGLKHYVFRPTRRWLFEEGGPLLWFPQFRLPNYSIVPPCTVRSRMLRRPRESDGEFRGAIRMPGVAS